MKKSKPVSVGGSPGPPSPKVLSGTITACGFDPRSGQSCDWYGNTRLHNLIGSVEYNSPGCIAMVESLALENPQSLSSKNQFNRLPVHYALDRLSGKLNIEVITFLVNSYPQGVTEEDNEGKTAYDLCKYWSHPHNVKCLIVNAAPDFYGFERLELGWGHSLAAIVDTLFQFRKSRGDYEQQNFVTTMDTDTPLVTDITTDISQGSSVDNSNSLTGQEEVRRRDSNNHIEFEIER